MGRPLRRERLDSGYVYLHVEVAVREEQLRHRRELVRGCGASEAEVSDAMAIRVLLDLVRHPGSTPLDVARRLQGLSPRVGLPQVQEVFARFELGEKGGPSTS